MWIFFFKTKKHIPHLFDGPASIKLVVKNVKDDTFIYKHVALADSYEEASEFVSSLGYGIHQISKATEEEILMYEERRKNEKIK